MSIPKQVEVNGWIHLTPYNSWTFTTNEDMSDYGYAMLMPYTINVEVPPGFDPTAQRIAALEKKREKLRREFQEEVMRVNEEISKLQAIGYVGPGATVIDPYDTDLPY